MAAADRGPVEGTATVGTFADEAALTLAAGPTELVLLPEVGMLGASLRHHGGEHLDLHGGPGAARVGHTTGLPLLAPWANRLAGPSYRAAGRRVDLGDAPALHRDGSGLPIHGTLVGRSGWELRSVRTTGGAAVAVARFDAGAVAEVMASFPFPHQLTVGFTVVPGRVTVATTLTPTGRRPVPVSFGWHPYLRLPGVAREELQVGLPARRRLELDDRQLPTGGTVAEPAEVVALAGRHFDDGYRLGRHRVLSLLGGGQRLDVTMGRTYRFAQVYAPAGRDFVALEPMTAATDALGRGEAAVVPAGGSFTARFSITLP